MSVISNPLLPDESFSYLGGVDTLDSKIATARKYSELFLRGDADLGEITAVVDLWLEIDEQLQDPKLAERGTEGHDYDFDEAAGEWPCTRVDCVDAWQTPWIDFGLAGEYGTVVESQAGTAWGRRFVRQHRDERWRVLDVAVYVDALASNPREHVYGVVARWTICEDYRDPSKLTEDDDRVEHYGEFYNEEVPCQDIGPEDEDGWTSIDLSAAAARARELCNTRFSIEDIENQGWTGQAEALTGPTCIPVELQIGDQVSW